MLSHLDFSLNFWPTCSFNCGWIWATFLWKMFSVYLFPVGATHCMRKKNVFWFPQRETVMDAHQGKDKHKQTTSSCYTHPVFFIYKLSRSTALLMHCNCLLPAVSFSLVCMCFMFLFHVLTFLALLRLGKYPTIPLSPNKMYFHSAAWLLSTWPSFTVCEVSVLHQLLGQAWQLACEVHSFFLLQS